MATFSYAPSLSADGTVRLLMSTLAQHGHQESVLDASVRPKGRLRALPSSSASYQARAQSTLLRLVSIIEAHTAAELIVRMESQVPPPRSVILEKIHTDAEDQVLGAWARTMDAYAAFFGIKRTGFVEWPKVQALIDARNAVAHGLGALTRRQTRKNLPQLVNALKSIDIPVVGLEVSLSEKALISNAMRGRDFVLWLDMLLMRYDAATP